MAGHIPESFIEELLSRVDIVEIIRESISTSTPLRRAGANYVSRCPFHTEKTPSFTVSQSKQFYHCFGCGAHGNALRFLMEYSGYHFVDAIESLAMRAGLKVPKEAEELKNETRFDKIYEMLTKASQYFQQQLFKHPTKLRAIDYLKGRGITGKTARSFHIGYAPEGWDGILQALGHPEALEHPSQNHPAGLPASPSADNLSHLLESGLLVASNKGHKDRYYDRFRDRIMFPIRDRRGRVVGFGGRVIEKGEPKYLNSPETVVFNKSQQVYGLYEARAANRTLTSLIVVEGYLDVVTLAQFGINNVVATLGTALTDKHLDLLFKQVNELYFCFDGDEAGRVAQKRALTLCVPLIKEGRTVKFIILPNGEDPDSFVRKNGKAGFVSKLQEAKSLSDFLFESLSAHLDLNSIEGRSELARTARALIQKFPAGVFQDLMLERLEQLTGMAPGTLVKRAGFYAKRSNAYPIKNMLPKKILPPTTAFKAIGLLLKHRELIKSIDKLGDLTGVDTPGTQLLCAMIEILRKDPILAIEVIEQQVAGLQLKADKDIGVLGSPGSFRLTDIMSYADSVPIEGLEAELLGALERLRERAKEQQLELLLQRAKEGTLTMLEKTELKQLLQQSTTTVEGKG